jgi:hypothetical protein
MKQSRWVVSSAVVLLALLSKTVSAESLTANLDRIKSFFMNPRPAQNHVALLFVQEADSGFLDPTKNRPGCYTLSLSNLHQHVLYFTDQPKRKAGKISTAQFVDIWQHNNVTPNIALNAFSVTSKNIHEINMVAVLKNPNYNKKDQSMRYTACTLAKQSTLQTKTALRSINLFIDDLHPWPP